MPDLNTLIINGAGGAGGSPVYTVVNFYTDSCLATITIANPPNGCYGADIGHLNANGSQHAADLLRPILQPELNFLLKRDLGAAANDNSPMWLDQAA